MQSAIYYEASTLVCEDQECWTLRGNVYIPVIMPPNTSDPARYDRMRAYGALLALSMVTQQEGLMNTSFGVILALILGSSGFDLSIDYLSLIDSDAAESLQVWYDLAADVAVPRCHSATNTSTQNELFSLICNLDIDVSHLSGSLACAH